MLKYFFYIYPNRHKKDENKKKEDDVLGNGKE